MYGSHSASFWSFFDLSAVLDDERRAVNDLDNARLRGRDRQRSAPMPLRFIAMIRPRGSDDRVEVDRDI